MKIIHSVLCSFILTGLFLMPVSNAEEVEFEVHGIACSFCAYGLEKKIKKMEGVTGISLNIKTGKAIVKTKEGISIDRAALKKAVKDAGLSMKADEPVLNHEHEAHVHRETES